MAALLPQSGTWVKTVLLRSHENQVVSQLWRRATGWLWVINFPRQTVFCAGAEVPGEGLLRIQILMLAAVCHLERLSDLLRNRECKLLTIIPT